MATEIEVNVNVNVVSWPSLYNPIIELSTSRDPVQPGGSYLVNPIGRPLTSDNFSCRKLMVLTCQIFSASLFTGLLYSTFPSMLSAASTPSSISHFHHRVDQQRRSRSKHLPSFSPPLISIKLNSGSSVHDQTFAVLDSPSPSLLFLHFFSLVSPVLSWEQLWSASSLQVCTRQAAFTCPRAFYCLCACIVPILMKSIQLGPVRVGCDTEPSRATGVSGPLFPLLLCNLNQSWQDLAVHHRHHLSLPLSLYVRAHKYG